jgi:hypothetical protein
MRSEIVNGITAFAPRNAYRAHDRYQVGRLDDRKQYAAVYRRANANKRRVFAIVGRFFRCLITKRRVEVLVLCGSWATAPGRAHGRAKKTGECTVTVTADDLDAAISSVASALSPATGRDWRATAGTGEWDCWHTAEHLGDCLMSYAAQVIARPATRYVRFLATADKDATPAEVLEFAVTGAGILSAAVRTTAPSVRAYHPSGMADPAGFAAMGCVEALVHGEDIARGLDVAVDPPRDLCARVVSRMFPHTCADLSETDPWTALLWATDRIELADRPRQQGWRWRGKPLDE